MFVDERWLWLGFGVLVGAAAVWVLRQVALNTYRAAPAPPTAREPSTYSNEEVYEWVDWKGRNRKLVVHRDVRETN